MHQGRGIPRDVSMLRGSRNAFAIVATWRTPGLTGGRLGAGASNVAKMAEMQPGGLLTLHMDSPDPHGRIEDMLVPGFTTTRFPQGTPDITVHVNLPGGATASFTVPVIPIQRFEMQHRTADYTAPSFYGQQGEGATLSITWMKGGQEEEENWIMDQASMDAATTPAVNYSVHLVTSLTDAVLYHITWREQHQMDEPAGIIEEEEEEMILGMRCRDIAASVGIYIGIVH